MWNSKCNTDKQTRRKLCSFWKGSLVWVCARLYFVVVVCYTWIEMQSTRWLSEDWHSIFVCFSHIFVSFCVCLCFVVVVIEMQSTRWLSGDRHSHRLLTKISLACRDRPHTPPISSFSVVYTFVLAVCVLCTLCMHIYQKVTSENKTHTANFI